MSVADRGQGAVESQQELSSFRLASVILTLGRFEGARLVRHPLVLGGTGLSLLLLTRAVRHDAPVLPRDDMLAAEGLFALAAGVLLASSLAVLRSRRHGTDEVMDGLPAPPLALTLSHLTAIIWPGGLACLIVAGYVGYLYAAGGIGTPSWAELCTGPVIVVLAGLLGVLVARCAPSPAAGPVAVVALAAAQLASQQQFSWNRMLTSAERLPFVWPISNASAHAARFALWYGYGPTWVSAPEVVVRPAGWHLLYLMGLVGLVGALAVLCHGKGGRPLLAATLSLALVAAAGVAQVRSLPTARLDQVAAAINHPVEHSECLRRDLVRYCAFPAYRPWTARWAAPVDGVLRQVPRSAVPPNLAIVQLPHRHRVPAELPLTRLFERPVDALASQKPYPDVDDGMIGMSFGWGRGSMQGRSEFGLALNVAAAVTGLDARLTAQSGSVDRHAMAQLRAAGFPQAKLPAAGQPKIVPVACDPRGQAREIVALWLAAQATAGSERALRDYADAQIIKRRLNGWYGILRPGSWYADIYSSYDPVVGPQVAWSKVGVALALQLLDEPADQIARRLRADWQHWTDVSTNTDELVTAFGLVPPRDDQGSPTATSIGEDSPRAQGRPRFSTKMGPPSVPRPPNQCNLLSMSCGWPLATRSWMLHRALDPKTHTTCPPAGRGSL